MKSHYSLIFVVKLLKNLNYSVLILAKLELLVFIVYYLLQKLRLLQQNVLRK